MPEKIVEKAVIIDPIEIVRKTDENGQEYTDGNVHVDIVYPPTPFDAVFDAEGITLTEKMGEIEQKIPELPDLSGFVNHGELDGAIDTHDESENSHEYIRGLIQTTAAEIYAELHKKILEIDAENLYPFLNRENEEIVVRSGTDQSSPTTGVRTVTFKKPFDTIPNVVISPFPTNAYNSDIICNIRSVSESGFTYYTGYNARFSWIAVSDNQD